ncbi:MAG TPA: glycosyltransferase family 39 protein [Candidatus Woesebacteria bacterium]|nr:glycosyltransferase family 39 protein [Candidatus Woesebacteria bacterium]
MKKLFIIYGVKRSIILLFISAFLIRLISLNQSLWLDEAITAVSISKFSFTEIVTTFSPNDFHPPLFYLFIKLWTGIFGTSEIALRMPSVLFSLLTGYVIYHIGIRFLDFARNEKYTRSFAKAQDDKIGFWSAAFFLFNPLIVYYSQEARMYMMATFFIVVNFYLYLQLREKRTVMLSILFMITILFCMMTFYGSIFYIGTLIMYAVLKKEFKIMLLSSAGLFGSLVLLYPLLSVQMQHSGVVLQTVKNWDLTLGTVTIKQLVLFPIKFATGRISFEPKYVYFFIGGVWTAFLSLVLFRGITSSTSSPRNDKETESLDPLRMTMVFFTIVPLILGIIISFHTPLLQYFRFQFVLIFLSLLLGITSYKLVKIRTILLSGLLIWSCYYLLFPAYHREDWKSLAAVIVMQHKPVYIVSSSTDPITYYVPATQTRSLKSLETQIPQDPSIMIIPYTADIHGIEYKKNISTYFELVESNHVRGITYEIWNKIKTYAVK